MTPDNNRPPTLEEKKARLAEALREKAGKEVGRPRPLSFPQERLWFVEQVVPGLPLYNVPVALRLKGPLQTETLGRALTDIAVRHATLRTAIALEDGQPVQQIAPAVEIPLPVSDISGLPVSEREAAALTLATAEAAQPFDLGRAPLFRARLVRLAPEDHILVLTLHHIISDGWSVGVLLRELGQLYRRETLPALPWQYAAYASAERERVSGEFLRGEVAYWTTRLAGLPTVLELPSDRPRPAVPTFRGGHVKRPLPATLTSAVIETCRRERVTPFMFFLAVFGMLLGRYSGRDHLPVGCPVAGRTRSNVENLIGLFVNTLVMRIDLSGDPPFNELLQRVKSTTLEAFDHQDVPFERLVAELAPERSLDRHPIFQTAFSFDDGGNLAVKLPGLEAGVVPLATETSKFDLTLSVTAPATARAAADKADDPQAHAVVLEYSRDLFEDETAQRLVDSFGTLLASAIADPACRISRLEVLPPSERSRILGSWAACPRPYPEGKCIHELFEEQAARAPQAIALIAADAPEVVLTYAELNGRADQLAARLRAMSIGPDDLVAVAAERSIEMIVSLLAILKAGGAYLPLDPGYPLDRLGFLLKDSGARLILAPPGLADRFRSAADTAGSGARLLEVGTEKALAAEISPPSSVGPTNLAYVSYTSGSTGRPKGVAVPHQAVIRLVKGTNFARLGLGEVLVQAAQVSFDASTLEIWGALLNGGRLVVLPPGAPSLGDLGDAFPAHGVTTIFLTTALFNLMVEERPESLRGLRQLMFGGEKASAPHVRRALRELGDCRLIHVYGPTENTTFTTFRPLDPGEPISDLVPIGRPIANTTVYILDPNLDPVPTLVPGELYTGGAGLARGYLGRPDLTAERFLPDPFSKDPGSRLYRTGDLVRRLPDGDIEFLGRLDHQVKIRGFRVEPGEVETALLRHPGLREVVVLGREDLPGERRLVAYVAPTSERDLPTAGETAAGEAAAGRLVTELRSFLAQTLPEWMIPAAFVILERLPLSPTGKVDRAALPAPTATACPSGDETERLAPRDATELRLAEIWETILGRQSIGIRDNFFELGGHSLLAARMVAQVEKETGQRLPLATLFRTPTVEHLAAVLRGQVSELPYSPLVGLRTTGSARPIFCPPAVGGLPYYYAGLARELGRDQPVYGLQARGLYGAAPPFESLDEMAEAYIAAIKTIQPEGPYYLAGYCLGGVVAYAMALQLRQTGDPVGLLAVIDSAAPPPPGAGTGDEPAWFMYAWELVNRGLQTPQFVAEIEALDPEERLPLLFERGRQQGIVPPGVDDLQIFERWLRLYRASAAAYLRYNPPPCAVRTVLFLATVQPDGSQPDLGWRRLVDGPGGGLEISAIEGDHYNIITEPRVTLVAERIAEETRRR
jgi:amino acid adenylation domain-containing protein